MCRPAWGNLDSIRLITCRHFAGGFCEVVLFAGQAGPVLNLSGTPDKKDDAAEHIQSGKEAKQCLPLTFTTLFEDNSNRKMVILKEYVSFDYSICELLGYSHTFR